MATRITYSFTSFYGESYRVDIDDADFVGTALTVDIAPDGFTLKYDGETDTVNPGIMGSTCSVSLLVTPGNTTAIESFAADLLAGEETQFTIAVYKSSVLYWAGYLMQSLSGFEDIGISYFFTIRAVDGIGRLKEVEYKNDSGSPAVPFGVDTFLVQLVRCLNKIGTSALYWGSSDVFLRTVVNWQDGNMPATIAAKDPLAYSRVSGAVFAKQATSGNGVDFEYKSYYFVLQEFCQNWHARLILSDGAWRFEQVRERLDTTFGERRWSNTPALLSSTKLATYDKSIPQTGFSNRLHGGQFDYLPALNRVEVKYDHKTFKNYLAPLSWKWYNGSGDNSAYTQSGLSFDADTFFKVSGEVVVNISLPGSYTKPWRYIFGVELALSPGGYKIKSLTTPVGTGIPTLNRESPNWTVAGVYYEVSTPWIFTTNFTGPVSFSFFTPFVPSGQTGFSVDFDGGLGGEDYLENSVAATVNDWKWTNLSLQVAGSDQSNNFEAARKYQTNNNATGTSEVVKIDSVFGAAVYGWTPTKIQTSSNLSAWTDTTATWEHDNDGTALEFGGLLSHEILKIQAVPVQRYHGSLLSAALHVHSRVIFPDSSVWLMSGGEWRARDNMWNVELQKSTITDASLYDDGDIVILPGGEDNPGGTVKPHLVIATGDGSGGITVDGFEGGLALSLLTATTVLTEMVSGTITSIPVANPIKANSLFDNDVVFVVDPSNGKTYQFVVDGNVSAGATSIAVNSVSIATNIPIGAQVIPSPLNLYTEDGGSGSGNPIGAAQGQVLRWDNSAAEWTAYSGVTDGHYLRWDTTNGWQDEAGPSGTVPNGSNAGEILRWNTAGGGSWEIYNGTTDGNVLTWDTTNGWQSESAATGAGDILDGGNTTGAAVTIGTNDAFGLNLETTGVTRMAITGGASTGGAVTVTNVTANTATVQDVLTLQTNSSGTAATGFGGGILFQGESTTTNNRDIARIQAAWAVATDAARSGQVEVQVGSIAGALTTIAKFDANGASNGQMVLGASSAVTFRTSGITTTSAFTVGGSSSTLSLGANTGSVNLYNTGVSNIGIYNSENLASSTANIQIGASLSFTQTNGTRNYLNLNSGFAPTSGTAVHNQFVFSGIFNQTGGANGITRNIYINPTLTAVADLRCIEIGANSAAAKGVYQTGASTVNNFVGGTTFGSTSAPDASAAVDVVSTTKGLGAPTMTTTQRDAISAPRDGLVIYNSTIPAFQVRTGGAWVSMGASGGLTGALTSTRVPYASGASTLTDSANLFWDNSNTGLGIGVGSVPAGASLSLNAKLRMKSGSGNGQIYWAADGSTDANTRIENVGSAIVLSTYGSSTGLALFDTNSSTYSTILYNNGNTVAPTGGGYFIADANTGFTSPSAGIFRIQEYSGGVQFYRADTTTTFARFANSKFGVGVSTTPTARIQVIGEGSTSATWGLQISNSTPAITLSVRDDQRVGILTTAPAVTLDAISATDGIGLPTGTTAQRPSVNSSLRLNSTVGGLEVRNGAAWNRLTCTTTPTIAAGAAAGTLPTVTVDLGNDLCHQVTVTTGTSPTTGTLCTVSFNQSLDGGLGVFVVFSARNAATAAEIAKFYIGTTGNSSYTIDCGTAPTASTTYIFHLITRQ